jgi:hypothetical protein
MQFRIFFMPQGYSLHQGGNLDHLRMVLMKVISTVENDIGPLYAKRTLILWILRHEILIGGSDEADCWTR